jgi:predicted CoA-binding protein
MSPETTVPADRVLMDLLSARPVIALIGASSRSERPSHSVMRQLLEQRYTVIPVNPNQREVLGQPCFPDLRVVPRRVDLVDVFRRAEATPEIARAAVEVGARTLWLQLGVINEEAAGIARTAGLLVVMDRCIIIEHERLVGMPFPAERPPAAASDGIGLCRDCRHARQVPATNSTYWLCRRSSTDPSFPKYPRLPVRTCRGFQWSDRSAVAG